MSACLLVHLVKMLPALAASRFLPVAETIQPKVEFNIDKCNT